MLIDAVFIPFAGGIETHAYELANSLVSKGYKIFVLSKQGESASMDFEKMGNLTVKTVPSKVALKGKGIRSILPMSIYLFKVLYLLLRYSHRYDILLVSGYKMLSLPAILTKTLCNKKCVIRIEVPTELKETISDESLKKMNFYLGTLLSKILYMIRNKLIKKVDSFVAVSNEIRKELNKLNLIPEKIYSIPNGIDIKKYSVVTDNEKTNLRRKFNLPLYKMIFIFTGRLAVSKGIPMLIDIWNNLIKKFEDIHLLLVGSGEGCLDNFEDKLKQHIKVHNLQETVSLTGNVENVNEYLQASDIFVFPSELESFGLSIIEAMACGIPSVITKVGISNAVIRNYENGILVNPTDKEAFETAICWMLDNKNQWRSMGNQARKSILKKYSIEAVAESYCKMFAEL